MKESLGIGIVGCGVISDIYLTNISSMFSRVHLAGCSDALPEKAEEKSRTWNIPACTTDELMASDDVDIILNLTTPPYHAGLNRQALESGKHIYCEKPFAMDRKDARGLVALAAEKGLRAGGAPDTFLGAALQTCRKIIDDGRIGRPLSCFAAMHTPGHERWHPAPDFYYKAGGGPMLDMGPYYLTALASLLGPVASVQALTTRGHSERTRGAGPGKGGRVGVEVSTLYQGLLEFESGVTGSINMSFDTWRSEQPRLEVHGTEGSLLIPDPNTFGGSVRLVRDGDDEPVDIPISGFPYDGNSRGLGVADMADAIITGRRHRTDASMAAHVLDVMLSFDDAGESRAAVAVESSMERPAPLSRGLKKGDVS